jgi:hypothetical protein
MGFSLVMLVILGHGCKVMVKGLPEVVTVGRVTYVRCPMVHFRRPKTYVREAGSQVMGRNDKKQTKD